MNQNGYGFALAFLMFSGCRSFVWLVVVRWLLAQDLWPDPNHATPHPQYGSSDAIHMSAFVITVASDTHRICRHLIAAHAYVVEQPQIRYVSNDTCCRHCNCDAARACIVLYPCIQHQFIVARITNTANPNRSCPYPLSPFSSSSN